MATVQIDFNEIYDWDNFHSTFFTKIGFPGYYDQSLSQWVALMGDLESGDCHLTLEPEEKLRLKIFGTENANCNCPDVFSGFINAVAAANLNYADNNSQCRILLELQ